MEQKGLEPAEFESQDAALHYLFQSPELPGDSSKQDDCDSMPNLQDLLKDDTSAPSDLDVAWESDKIQHSRGGTYVSLGAFCTARVHPDNTIYFDFRARSLDCFPKRLSTRLGEYFAKAAAQAHSFDNLRKSHQKVIDMVFPKAVDKYIEFFQTFPPLVTTTPGQEAHIEEVRRRASDSTERADDDSSTKKKKWWMAERWYLKGLHSYISSCTDSKKQRRYPHIEMRGGALLLFSTSNIHRLTTRSPTEPETSCRNHVDMFINFQEKFLDVVVRMTDRDDPCRVIGAPFSMLEHVFGMVAPECGAHCAARLRELLVASSQGEGPAAIADRYIVNELGRSMPQLNAVYVSFLAVSRKRVEFFIRKVLDVPVLANYRISELVVRYQEVYLVLCTVFQQALDRCVMIALEK